MGRRGSAFAQRHLNAHARQVSRLVVSKYLHTCLTCLRTYSPTTHHLQCYWRALLLLYANRLQQPPSLARWPEAQKARGNKREGWYPDGSERAAPRVRWDGIGPGWRRRDEASMKQAVQTVEEELAAAPPEQSFTTAVERRSPVF